MISQVNTCRFQEFFMQVGLPFYELTYLTFSSTFLRRNNNLNNNNLKNKINLKNTIAKKVVQKGSTQQMRFL
jgi:hypothetical protein